MGAAIAEWQHAFFWWSIDNIKNILGVQRERYINIYFPVWELVATQIILYSLLGSSLYSSRTTVVEGGDVALVKVVEREREREKGEGGHIIILKRRQLPNVVHISAFMILFTKTRRKSGECLHMSMILYIICVMCVCVHTCKHVAYNHNSCKSQY